MDDSDLEDTILKSRSPYRYPMHVNISNFVTIKLSSTNFLYWEMQFITRSEISPPIHSSDDTGAISINPKYRAWDRTDRLVKLWLTSTISEEMLGEVIGLKTSHQVWTALSAGFMKSSQSREFKLLSQL